MLIHRRGMGFQTRAAELPVRSDVASRLTMRARGPQDSHRQIGIFVALDFLRFVRESLPASRL